MPLHPDDPERPDRTFEVRAEGVYMRIHQRIAVRALRRATGAVFTGLTVAAFWFLR